MTEKKTESTTRVYSYEVNMLVHVVADNEKVASTQLDEKGGIVTKREVTLVNDAPLYGEEKDKD
jgi:hypothetical protein